MARKTEEERWCARSVGEDIDHQTFACKFLAVANANGCISPLGLPLRPPPRPETRERERERIHSLLRFHRTREIDFVNLLSARVDYINNYFENINDVMQLIGKHCLNWYKKYNIFCSEKWCIIIINCISLHKLVYIRIFLTRLHEVAK